MHLQSIAIIDWSFCNNFCSCLLYGCTYKSLIQTHLFATIFVVAYFLDALAKVWYRLIFLQHFFRYLLLDALTKVWYTLIFLQQFLYLLTFWTQLQKFDIDSSFCNNFCSCILFGRTYIQTYSFATIFVVAYFLGVFTKVSYSLIYCNKNCSCILFDSTYKSLVSN